LTLVASWNPVVFADDLFIILPATSELEDAVVECWRVEWGLVALDSAVFEHVEVVVASFSLVVQLWNTEEVGITLAGDWHKLSWRRDDLEDGFWNKIDWLVALWDLVGRVVDRLVPAATSNGDALEFWNTRETTVGSLVDKRTDFGVGIDCCETSEWIRDGSGVDNGVKLETVSEKSRALRWWSKSSVPDGFFFLPFSVDQSLHFSLIDSGERILGTRGCRINSISRLTIDIFEQVLAADSACANQWDNTHFSRVLIDCPSSSVVVLESSCDGFVDVFRFDRSSNLKLVLVVEDEEDVVVTPWDISSLCDLATGECVNLIVTELDRIPATVWSDLTLLGIERTSTTVLVLLAWVSVLKVVHSTGVESEEMDVDEEQVLSRVDTNWELGNEWLVDDVELFRVELSRSDLHEDVLDLTCWRVVLDSHHEDTGDFWDLVGAEKRRDVEVLGALDAHHKSSDFWSELLVWEDPLDHVVLVGWLERSAACFGGKELNKRWGNSDCLVELELHELFSAGTVDVHEVLVLLWETRHLAHKKLLDIESV